MMKCFNKRGISPLIATVLIIGFTVALSAVVMTWGTGFVRDTTTATAEQTNLALSCAKLNYQVGTVTCSGGAGARKIDTIEVVNNGDQSIVSTIFRITRTTGTTTLNTVGTVAVPSVGPFEVKPLTPTPPDTAGEEPSRLGVIAKIVNPANNEEVTCADTIIEKANPCA